jgi:Stress responsive A/B Barrel Domain
MRNKFRIAFIATVAISFSFFCGWTAARGNLSAPNTIIHHVALKWKADTTDADKQKAITMLKEIVDDTPGAKNMWTRTVKIQPKEYSQTFVIEFENEAALKAYAEHPKKKEWEDLYYKIRETSNNCVTGN